MPVTACVTVFYVLRYFSPRLAYKGWVATPSLSKKDGSVVHRTAIGSYILGASIRLLGSNLGKRLKGRVQLIVTSPPFPLNNKKSYGNLQGRQYLKWFTDLAPLLSSLLTPNGSIVME